jgi:hypothetical protein
MQSSPGIPDAQAARGLQLCLLQLAREARTLGLTFAAAHMEVAALEIADSIGSAPHAQQTRPSVANDASPGVAAPSRHRIQG